MFLSLEPFRIAKEVLQHLDDMYLDINISLQKICIIYNKIFTFMFLQGYHQFVCLSRLPFLGVSGLHF